MGKTAQIVTFIGAAIVVAIALRLVAGPIAVGTGFDSLYADAKIGAGPDGIVLTPPAQLASRAWTLREN
jgi:hypothetical protein